MLWLHIGHFKTGTTALQVFCEDNEAALRREGIDYSRECREFSKHSALAFALYHAAGMERLMHGYTDPRPPELFWDALFRSVVDSPRPATLISSEEFIRLGACPEAEAIFARIIAPWRERIEFRVMVWLRPCDDHLRSWYNQLVKMDIEVPGFNAAVSAVMEPVHYDYGLAIAPWVRLFGPQAVYLRGYRDEMRAGLGLYEDFLDTLGLDPGLAGRWRVRTEDLNPRLDDRVTEVTRLSHQLGLNAEQRGWFMDRVTRALADDDSQREYPPKPPEQIVAENRAGIEALADLPESRLDLDMLRRGAPRFDDPMVENLTFALKVVLREAVHNRRQAAQAQNRILERLRDIESRLGEMQQRR